MINTAAFRQILRSTVLIPLIGMILLVAVLFLQLVALLEAAHWTDHTYQVIAQTRKSRNIALHMESEQYAYFLTNDSAFRTHLLQDSTDLMTELHKLRQLVKDRPSQVQRTREIEDAFEFWQRISQQESALFQQHGRIQVLIARERAAQAHLGNLFDVFRTTEEGLLQQRTSATQSAAVRTEVFIVALTTLLGVVLGIFLRRQMLTLAKSYGGALESLQEQADTLHRNADEIQALNMRLEQRVEERTAQLEASNRELESFSYSVSHDLRAPLRSIDGFSQALLEDYAEVVDAEGKMYLERIRSNSRQMAGLIDALLNLSRLTRAEMRRAPVDLTALAHSVCEELRQRDPDRQVRVEIADGLAVEGDERLLRVALENLFGNAWKFTSKIPEATIQFASSTASGEAGRDTVSREETGREEAKKDAGRTVYFVKDNGAGFDMAYADKLFGAFQRLHGVSEFEGTGIGLATVQRVIRRHGGHIWAEGAVGQGATFFFTLD